MKLDFAMLTDKAIRKIQLLTFMRDHNGQFNLADFTVLSAGTYSQAYHTLLNLRMDLQRLAPATQLTKDRLVSPITVDAYRHWLYVQSVPYQALLATLVTPELGINDLCARYDISQSTFNRRMRAMRQQLAQYNLELTTNPLRLMGDEALVQLLYLMMFRNTLTSLAELPAVPDRFLDLYAAMQATYATAGIYQESTGLRQQRDLLMTIALLRLDQGHRYARLRLPLIHLTDLRSLAAHFQALLGDTPRQALNELATLDYLLTSSPYFIRALTAQSMRRLYLGQTQQVADYQLAPGVATLADYAQGNDWFANWLFALCQFMLLFRVDPLLRPEITALYRPTERSTQAAKAIASSMARLYPQQITPGDLRLVQRHLSKYTNGLNLTAAKVEILVSYDMLGVTTDIFNRLIGGVVHLQLLENRTVVPPAERANYLVIYGVDGAARTYAQDNQIESFHWVKELAYGENLDRLIKTLRHHELSIFALDFGTPLQRR